MRDNYSITILNMKTSALIRRSSRDGFIVQSLEDGSTKFIADLTLKDCKTMQDFLARFSENSGVKRILLSVDANSKIISMLSASVVTTEADSTQIPYSVVDLTSLLLVTKSQNGFEVESLATGTDKFVPSAKLFGNYYKYIYDFAITFSNGIFSSLDKISIILSAEAYNSMIAIMAFNRIDC